MSDPRKQIQVARSVEQSRVIERPGGATGFDAFYASGTWIPTFVGSTIAGTFTYDATLTGGTYARIGNQVVINGRVRITAIGVAPTGNLQIGSLPITSATTGNNYAGSLACGAWTGITLTGARTQLAAVITDTLAVAILFESGSNLATAVVQGAGLVLVGGVADIRFSGSYKV